MHLWCYCSCINKLWTTHHVHQASMFFRKPIKIVELEGSWHLALIQSTFACLACECSYMILILHIGLVFLFLFFFFFLMFRMINFSLPTTWKIDFYSFICSHHLNVTGHALPSFSPILHCHFLHASHIWLVDGNVWI